MKYCRTCSSNKTTDQFYKHKGHSDGLSSNCKDCVKARSKEYKKNNPEKVKAAVQKCYKENKDAYAKKRKEYYKKHVKEAVQRAKEWAERNPNKMKECRTNWKRNNRHKVNFDTAKRRAGLLNATPSWLSEEDLDLMKSLYEESSNKSKKLGIKFHVDHIVPLISKYVCGLHVPWNLQVITEEVNLKKSNKILIEEQECLN